MSVRQDRTNALALVKLDRRLVLTRSQMRSSLADGLSKYHNHDVYWVGIVSAL